VSEEHVRVAGLILAAGESRRMGRPKALLEIDGRSFVSIGIELLHAGGCAPVLVVDGAHRLEQMLGAEIVHNLEWEGGPLSSLQVGLRRALVLAPLLDAILVHHVERPRVRVETIQALLAGLEREPDGIWQPMHLGRSGHPLVWPRVLFDELLALDPNHASARDLLRGSAAERRRKLDLDDPGVLDNLDTPDDLARLQR
jgi:molybdenum cofactor cytidylyltransferase